MSTYSDASLIFYPSGYKAGTAYSLKPTDGSGDLTFTRASSATRVNSDGLIEKVRTNLLLQSNNFDTTWTNTNSTETSGQAGYDGTNDAWLLTRTGGNGRVQQSISNTGVQTFSIYAKANTLSWIVLEIAGIGFAYYDIENGVLGTNNSGISTSIDSVGNSWYRCSFIGNGTSTTTRVYLAVGDNDISGTSGSIYIQDAQLEQGLVATDYIETTTTSVVTGITNDMPRLDYSGGASCPSLLLEPSRTNLVTLSEYPEGYAAAFRGSFNTNAAISPQGVQNASLFTEDTTSNNTHFYALTSLSWVAGTTYTISVYAKSNGRSIVLTQGNPLVINFTTYFNLTTGEVGNSNASNASIENVGNGWYRCSVTQTALTTSGTNILIPAWHEEEWNYVYTGNGVSGFYSYGHQLESGSYPTSYIPTYGTSATRTADAAYKTGISSLIGQTEGTLYAEYTANHEGGSGERIYAIGDGTANNRIVIFEGSNKIRVYAAAGGSVQWDYLTTIDFEGTHKVAVAYAANNAAIYVDGTQVGTDSSFVVPSVGNVYLGTPEVFGVSIGGAINQALLFPTRLTNAQLAELTTL